MDKRDNRSRDTSSVYMDALVDLSNRRPPISTVVWSPQDEDLRKSAPLPKTDPDAPLFRIEPELGEPIGKGFTWLLGALAVVVILVGAYTLHQFVTLWSV